MKKNRSAVGRKVAGALLLVFLFTFLMSSCDKIELPSKSKRRVLIDDFLVKTEDKNGADQTIQAVEGILGAPVAISGDVLITGEEKGEVFTQRVYNIATSRQLATVSGEERLLFVSSLLDHPETAQGIYLIIGHETLRIYNSDGSLAISTLYNSEERPTIQDSVHGFTFNDAEVFVRDGQVLLEGINPLESEYFNASVLYNGLYYYCSESRVLVFNDKGFPVYSYMLPSYAQNAHIYVLSGGNIFIQYSYTAAEGEEYDYSLDGQKMKLVSLLANLKKNTETTPQIRFLVDEVANPFTDPDFHMTYTDMVSNVAKVREISNKRLDQNLPARFVSLSDNLIEVFGLNDVINGALDITRLSYDRYLASTLAGDFLVSGHGALIGQLNNTRLITENFIFASGCIYDHDLNQLLNLTGEGFTMYGRVGDNIVLSKPTEESADLYLFTGDTPVRICEVGDFVQSFEGYGVKDETGCRYYNENGEQIASAAGTIEWLQVAVRDGNTICLGYVPGTEGRAPAYYRLSFSGVMELEDIK